MRLKALIVALAAMLATPVYAAGYGDFTGNWRNDDAGTRDITRVRVTPSGGGLSVRVWGQCHPTDCDWGTANAVPYGPSVSANPAVSATDIIVEFSPGFAKTTLILTDRPGDRLSYAIFTRFTDGSGRRSYVARGTLRKQFGGWPGWPPGGPGWPPGGPSDPGGPGGPGGPGASGITVYEHVNFDGASQFFNTDVPNLVPMGWNDLISSLRVSGPGAWEVCENVNYTGRCRVVTGDVPNLVPGGWNDMISSVRRYTGGPGGGSGVPATHSTNTLSVPQTYTFDLDEGGVGGGPDADMWFEAVTAWEMYLTPRNGARMWLGDGSNRGYAGCSSGGPYSPARIALDSFPAGTYVCVRTNQGRYSQFRVNAILPGPGGTRTLSLGYTTWE